MLPTNYRVALFPSDLTHDDVCCTIKTGGMRKSQKTHFFKKICLSLNSSVLVGLQGVKDILDLSSNGDLCRTDSFTIRTIRVKKYATKNAAYTDDRATDTASRSRRIKESNGEKNVLMQTFEINEEVKRAAEIHGHSDQGSSRSRRVRLENQCLITKYISRYWVPIP